MVLLIFGTGVNCQVALSGNTAVTPSPKGVSASSCGRMIPIAYVYIPGLSLDLFWMGRRRGAWCLDIRGYFGTLYTKMSSAF
jgi:hypothetical protein